MLFDVSIERYILQGAFPGLLSAVFLITFILMDRTFSNKILNLFMTAITMASLLVAAESIDYYLEKTHTNLPLRIFLAAVCYTCRIGAIGFTVAISQRTSSKSGALIYSGILINAFISFLSIPTGCVFRFDEAPNWYSGHLFLVPYFFTLYYTILLWISSFKKLFSNIGEAVITIGIFIVCTTANALELIYGFKLLMANALLISIEFYFLCLNVQLYRRDSLTNLLNRRSFYMDAKRHDSKTLTVLSIDLNNLKTYNDLEGHKAGDLALITVSNYLVSAFKKHGFPYRTGGDEFMVLFVEKSEDEVKEAIASFNQRLSRTRYSVACGYSICHPGENFDNAVEIADSKMYENKRQIKGCEGR